MRVLKGLNSMIASGERINSQIKAKLKVMRDYFISLVSFFLIVHKCVCVNVFGFDIYWIEYNSVVKMFRLSRMSPH